VCMYSCGACIGCLNWWVEDAGDEREMVLTVGVLAGADGVVIAKVGG
jgi:hypothetical protein